MNIDREQLIDLLVERTPRGREEVERQFNEMIAEITDLTAEGKPYTIDGFGTFSLQDGLLTFEAAEELQTEINYKYVGMNPVEIVKPNRDMPEADAKSPVQEKPETESPEPEPVPEVDSSDEDRIADIWGIPSASELDERVRQREEETEEESKPGDKGEPTAETTDDEQEPEEESVAEDAGASDHEAVENDEAEEESEEAGETGAGDVTGDLGADADETPSEEKEPEIESDPESDKALQEMLESEEPLVEEETAADEEPEAKPDRKKEKAASSTEPKKAADKVRPKKRKVRKRSDYTIAVLFAIFSVIVATGVVYWAAMNPTHSEEMTSSSTTQAAAGRSDNLSEDAASGSGTPTATGDGAAAEKKEADPPESSPDKTAKSAVEQADEMTQNQPETTSAETNEASGDIYGLHGEVHSSANDGYTIVIYSLKNGANARNIKGQIEADNYRALLKKVPNGNGETYWRVSIGQFETISDAQQAAEQLEQPYRDHHFIHRI